MITLTIDPDSHVPPFEQVRTQILDAVTARTLVAGDKLPPVRTLAAELGLAAGTVAKAYRALEIDAVIETRGHNGSFVSATGDPTEQNAQRAAADFAERMRHLGVAPEDAVDFAARALGIRSPQRENHST